VIGFDADYFIFCAWHVLQSANSTGEARLAYDLVELASVSSSTLAAVIAALCTRDAVVLIAVLLAASTAARCREAAKPFVPYALPR
jgi:hypothetical protein